MPASGNFLCLNNLAFLSASVQIEIKESNKGEEIAVYFYSYGLVVCPPVQKLRKKLLQSMIAIQLQPARLMNKRVI